MFTWLANRLAGNVSSKQTRQMSEKLYASIVAQARQPVFYRELAIPDTIPGRFEMVSLHMFIILDRLSNHGGAFDEVGQQLVNDMFQDMDDVARETGVGDMGVGPRIKKLARSFQSRLEFYKEAIEGEARGTLPEAIVEIHYKDDKSHLPAASRLAEYVYGEQTRVGEMSLEEMVACEPLFEQFETDIEGKS